MKNVYPGIEMGKIYRSKEDGEIFKPICIDRDSALYPVVMESGDYGFAVFTADGRINVEDEFPGVGEYIAEPEPINMRDRYESEGLPVEIFKITDIDVIALTNRGVFSFDFEGHFYSGKKDFRDLVKVESGPEMLVYKVRYHNPDRGYYETVVIASPAESLYPWFGKMGTQHESVEELEGLEYTGDSIEPVIIG